MEAKYINSFLEGLLEIFNQVANVQLKHLGTKVKATSTVEKGVVVMVGVTGELKGVVNINMSEDFAKVLVSNMMGGMTIEKLDEIAKSALSELLNITMGNISTKLSLMGVSIDITPPTMLTGTNIGVETVDIPLLSVTLGYEEYSMDFDISIK